MVKSLSIDMPATTQTAVRPDHWHSVTVYEDTSKHLKAVLASNFDQDTPIHHVLISPCIDSSLTYSYRKVARTNQPPGSIWIPLEKCFAI